MKYRKKRSFLPKILIVLAISIPIFSIFLWEQPQGVCARTEDTYKNLEAFSNVLSIVQQNYVEEVDTKEVIQGAIKGMLSVLDPHSSYMNPDAFKELQVETKGSFGGIGIEITLKDNFLTVVSPIEGTPAYKQGIKAGDRIVKIEDEPTKDMTLMEAVKRLRGPKGTKVTISIYREGWTEIKDVEIVRDVIPIHSVKSKLLEPGYPYIRIINFQAETTNDFDKALQGFIKEGPPIKGLVLDLRNDPGGLLDQAIKISDIFLDKGVIVSTKGRIKEQNHVYKAHDEGHHYTFPIVVLVNEGTASASEIVAGALKDHKKALILGAQTFGKGSVQTIIPMSNGAGLRLTTARYYTPNGTSIQATGITPDILVPTQIEHMDDTKKNDKDEEKPRFLREKDLKHHILNGSKPKKKIKKLNTKEESAEREIKETLEKDQQLRTGLMLLKGLNVFDGLKSSNKIGIK